MNGLYWKTLLKCMIWGENPLFSETSICFFLMVESAPPAPNRLPFAGWEDFQGDGTDRGILICEGAAT